jgi:cell division protein FtsZ
MQERIAAHSQPAGPPPAPAPSVAETTATAAVAAALEDVTIRPIPPKPTLFEPQQLKPAAAAEPTMPKVFIPPQAEKPASRAPRMPRIDEFPPHAQPALRAREAQTTEPVAAEDPADKPRMSLLARLASVGLGRREEAHHEEQPERPPVRQQMPPLPPRPQPRVEPVSEYAKRGVPQGLDQHGRPAPVHNQDADDQLEIPAFLRRQAK